MEDQERDTFAVTPPGGLDAPSFRRWAESEARKRGWRDLRWSDEVDQHGNPMGRLTGVRP